MMVVVAPIPMAIVSAAMRVTVGAVRKDRSA
jgi:hypothetical protein